MPLNITARAVTQDEVLDMGAGGPVVGASGEVLLQMDDGSTAYRFLLDGNGARNLGKALITEGWKALQNKFGARQAIREAFRQEKHA